MKVESSEPTANLNQSEGIFIEPSSSTMENPAPVLITVSPHASYIQPADANDNTNQSPKRRYTYGPIECDVCGRMFNSKSNLKVHRITHTDLRPYECWMCHKTFRLRASLKGHILIHTINSKIRKSFNLQHR